MIEKDDSRLVSFVIEKNQKKSKKCFFFPAKSSRKLNKKDCIKIDSSYLPFRTFNTNLKEKKNIYEYVMMIFKG